MLEDGGFLNRTLRGFGFRIANKVEDSGFRLEECRGFGCSSTRFQRFKHRGLPSRWW